MEKLVYRPYDPLYLKSTLSYFFPKYFGRRAKAIIGFFPNIRVISPSYTVIQGRRNKSIETNVNIFFPPIFLRRIHFTDSTREHYLILIYTSKKANFFNFSKFWAGNTEYILI